MQRFVAAARVVFGLVLILAASLICVGLFAQSRLRMFVPLGFAVLLIALAGRFGPLVSVLGSIMAALIFAWFLYVPLGSVRVNESSARANLGWMILAAVAVSNLLFPPPRKTLRK
jgi:K+-sensing histidine kinase KdpD